MKTNFNFDVIIPCYKSNQIINKIIDELASINIPNFQLKNILLVIDGIDDRLMKMLFDLKKKYQFISLIQLTTNFGQLEATRIGFEQAKSEIVVTIDDDDQHPVHEIKKILSKYQKIDFDLIYVTPIDTRKINFIYILSKLFKRIIFLIDNESKKYNNTISFRFINKKNIYLKYNKNKIKNSFYSFEKLLVVSSNKIHSEEVTYNHGERKQSRYSILKYFTLALNLIFLTRLKKSLVILYFFCLGFIALILQQSLIQLLSYIFFAILTFFCYLFIQKKIRCNITTQRDALQLQFKIVT